MYNWGKQKLRVLYKRHTILKSGLIHILSPIVDTLFCLLDNFVFRVIVIKKLDGLNGHFNRDGAMIATHNL